MAITTNGMSWKRMIYYILSWRSVVSTYAADDIAEQPQSAIFDSAELLKLVIVKLLSEEPAISPDDQPIEPLRHPSRRMFVWGAPILLMTDVSASVIDICFGGTVFGENRHLGLDARKATPKKRFGVRRHDPTVCKLQRIRESPEAGVLRIQGLGDRILGWDGPCGSVEKVVSRGGATGILDAHGSCTCAQELTLMIFCWFLRRFGNLYGPLAV